MQSKSLLWLTLFPLFLVQGCGGGGINIRAKDGSTINIKKENVFCEPSVNHQREGFIRDKRYSGSHIFEVECTANGVETDMVKKRYAFSQTAECWNHDDLLVNQKSIVCTAVNDFGLLKRYILIHANAGL